MNAKTMHLNLLQESERLSSSPVRLKVMLPIVTGVILAATLGWWGFLQLQLGMIGSEVKALKAEMAANRSAYDQVCKLKTEMRAKEAELGQFKGYSRARRTWGDALAALPEAIPDGVQLSMVEIPPPPPQNLNPPPGVKLPPLLGPTNATEDVVFRIAGRTAREESLFAFLKSVKVSAPFIDALVFAEGGATQSPRMRQFRQDSIADADGNRAIVFDIEYRTPGRNFAP